MAIEIRETTITPAQGGEIVQLYISDAARGDVSAEIALELSVLLPKRSKAAILERVQHQAMKLAQDQMSSLMPELARKAQSLE
jgi:hypothetical protein